MPAACLAIAGALSLSSCSAMLPVSATGKIDGAKTGTATATNVLGFWISNDASIRAAAANGGITHVSTVDVETTNYLWVVHVYKTVVVGD